MTEFARVTVLRARLVEHRWDWAGANRDRIAAHWEARRAATPKLFDGRVLMVAAARLAGGRLDLDMFATDYASFLAHIDWGFPDPTVRNGFAMGALQGSDGAFVLGVMAQHTANAGRLYFPAGTPDLGDVRPDGTVDLEGSILREIGEETGLAVGPDDLAPDWTLVTHEGRSALMRELRLDRPAAVLRAEILAYMAGDGEAELADIVVLRGPEEIEEARMPGFLPAYLRRAFAARPGGAGARAGGAGRTAPLTSDSRNSSW